MCCVIFYSAPPSSLISLARPQGRPRGFSRAVCFYLMSMFQAGGHVQFAWRHKLPIAMRGCLRALLPRCGGGCGRVGCDLATLRWRLGAVHCRRVAAGILSQRPTCFKNVTRRFAWGPVRRHPWNSGSLLRKPQRGLAPKPSPTRSGSLSRARSNLRVARWARGFCEPWIFCAD